MLQARTWYVMLVLLLWLAGGAGLLVYCLIDSTLLTVESIVQVFSINSVKKIQTLLKLFSLDLKNKLVFLNI